ncbi:hypothetical protein V5O48_003436 [Marasmius crinis-equi]|uniref:MYND-type domain-containing protein n=1 Tax=Marasmius crinis-equi TaxID=585013 RepID=A0ABR3FTQ9_9AGAR
MCPCAEAFYCSSEHQTEHWQMHRKACWWKQNKGRPETAVDAAIKYLLQHFETDLVEIACSAMLLDDKHANILLELQRKAVVITVKQRHDAEDMEVAHAAGRIPPFQLGTRGEVHTVLIEEVCKARGLNRPFLEDPASRMIRLSRQQNTATIIFQPTGRVVTKVIDVSQSAGWGMKQQHEIRTTNPPIIYWTIGTMNGRLFHTYTSENEKKEKKESQTQDADRAK